MVDNIKKGDKVEFINHEGEAAFGYVLFIAKVGGSQYVRVECDGHVVKVHITCIKSIVG